MLARQSGLGVTTSGSNSQRLARRVSVSELKSAKKRSLLVANEHFIRFAHRFAAVLKHVQPKGCELFFNSALTTQVIIQRFLRLGVNLLAILVCCCENSKPGEPAFDPANQFVLAQGVRGFAQGGLPVLIVGVARTAI